MSPNFIFATSIMSVSLVQGIMQIAALLKAENSNRKANYVMAMMIGMFVILSFDCYLQFTDSYRQFPHLIRVFTPFYLLFGILPCAYSRLLTDPDFKLGKNCFLHFIPFFILIALYFPVYFSTAEEKIRYIAENQNFIKRKIIMLYVMLSNSYYLTTGYLRLRRYHRNIEDYYSNISALKVRWMEHLYIAFLIVHFTIVIGSLIFTNDSFKVLYELLFYGFFVLIFSSGYLSMRQSDPLTRSILLKEQKPQSSLNKDMVPQSTVKEVKESLDKVLYGNKIYLERDLNLDVLAKATGYPNYLVSITINQAYEMTFFELINSLRIKEACDRLKSSDYKHLTIIAIAEDVGFNSKSSFNAEFKKRIGKTPSEFRSTNS